MSLKDRADNLDAISLLFSNQEDPGDLSDEPTKEIYFDFSTLNFDEDAIKENMEEQAGAKKKNAYGPFTWLEPVCDCGGDKLKTTHYNWCSKTKRGW
jgi:hypothetical protein